MRIKRYKKAQKVLGFYETNFGFKEPYQVIVDGTFSLMALRRKINIAEQLPKYLASECVLCTTLCCLKETEKLGPDVHGAWCILKQFKAISCGHKEKPLPASACIHQLTKKDNPDQYFVATQDKELQEKLEKCPAIPILYLHHQSITLVKPSDEASETAKEIQNSRTDLTDHEKDVLAAMKKQRFGDEPSDAPKKKKKRGPKQPNPLSCKKSKKKLGTETNMKAGKEISKRRKGRHKKLKMSEELKAIEQKLLVKAANNEL